MISDVVDARIDVAEDVIDGIADGIADVVASVGGETGVRSSVRVKARSGVEVVVAGISNETRVASPGVGIGDETVVAGVGIGDETVVAGVCVGDEARVAVGVRCNLVVGQEGVGASPSAGHRISPRSSIGILLIPSSQRGGGEGVGVGQGVASQKVVVAVVDEAVASS